MNTSTSSPAATTPSSWLTDLAYVAPMAVFLLLTQAGNWWPKAFVAGYIAKTFLAAGLLILFRRHYTRIRWDYWWLGLIFGVIGIVQWVGMEELLLKFWPSYPHVTVEPLDPYKTFSSPAMMWTFILIRWAGAALMVPFMEELFWRDYLWRTIAAPNNFRLAEVGEWDPKAFLVVAAFFATVHIQWMTAVVWGLMIGGLLVWTRSLGACIIAHGVTNLLLGAYVQWTGKWYYW